ncbi:MAG: PilZ domain-containing protein [Polyangiales bacterium]|nr:PilZ domain-containing protein [Sandaracinaceae bacterium]
MANKSHGRTTPRAELSLRVAFQTRDGLEHTGTTRDLGVRGASVETPRPPAEGATVALRIDSPTSWDPIILAGVVQWSSTGPRVDEHGNAAPPGFGVRFGKLTDEHSAAIRALIATRAFDED